jgi:manganese-dependent ADP-ribose/CDP-alcohol diphosphatase
MKLSVEPFALPCIAAILALASQVSAADFLDDFSADTSADYIYTSTYGTDTATWDVSGGTLNLPVSGGGGQTANLFYDTATLAVGETVSVDLSGRDDVYLTVSTTTFAPNVGANDGVRLNWMLDTGKFRARSYTNGGTATNTNFHTDFDVNGPASLTLYLTRESDNTFSAAYSSIGGAMIQLNTTGGTEKQIFTAGDTGNGDLYIGVETFGSGVRNFDNLQVSAPDFLDDFSTDTSADYIYTSTYGTDTATWNVSSGSLNLPVTGGGSQTANLFYGTAILAIGDTVSVDLSGLSDVYLTVSTTTRGPNTSGEDGVRLNWNPDGTFKVRRYTNGSVTDTNFHSSFDVATGALTLYLTRESDNTFSAAYDSGSGLTQLNTTGGTEQQTFTAGDTGNGDLYIGVETYGSGTRSFDNLRVGILAEQPILSSFTASATTISEAGEVTFTWSASNASTVTLNGQDVTGQSPLTVLVAQTQDFTLVVTSDSGATLSQVTRVTIGESFSIAAVADPQYADVPTGWRGGGREPEEGVNRLSHAITHYNQRNLDWGVMVGDLIDFDDIDYDNPPPGTPSATGTQDWSNSDAILGAWDQINVPSYLVIGNHEYYVPNVDVDGLQKPYSVYRKFGFKDRAYYDFRHKGFRFVVLDGDNCYLNFDLNLPEYQQALDYYQGLSGQPQQRWWNAGISIDQRKWLMDVLDHSNILDEPVVIMCHYPIHTPVDHHSLLNSTELLDIVNGYSNVVMWMNGHYHQGSYTIEGRRHHLGLKGMQNEAENWYQLDFSPSQITVYQAENTTTPVYDLDISRPTPTVTRPTGFAATDAVGDASLTWDVEPVEATHVVVERRHLSTLSVELPSTAQTLSWQTLATLALPTTQSYLDAPANPIAEYKYRIRFLGGAEGSHYSQALAPDESAQTSYEDYTASLGTGYELVGVDTDGDGTQNGLEQFYGTSAGVADRDSARELRLSRTPSGETQLVFSYDGSALVDWDIALSKDLITWKTISRDVDYRVVQTEVWTPTGSSESLTRITIETMDGSSFDFEPDEPANFFKLAVTPSS